MNFTNFTFEQQKITTNGLIMNVDAGNISSYSGTGITFSDLSNSRNNAIGFNSPAFTSLSNNGSYFTFLGSGGGSGSNAYFTNGLSFSVDTSYTICAMNNKVGGTNIISYGYNQSYFILGYNVGGTLARLLTSRGTLTGTTTPNTNWNYLCAVFNYGVGFSLYLNGVLETFLAFTSSFGNPTSPSINFPYRTATIFPGIISAVQVYNRALTAQEVSQNFNLLRGRYGI